MNTLDAGTGYLDLGLSIVSPDENLLAYSARHQRRRGVHAPLPRPAHRRRPARRRRGRRLHRRLDVGLRRPSSTPCPTSPGATSGSACTGSARLPRTTPTCSSSPTGGSRSPCGGAAASRRSWCSARAATPPRLVRRPHRRRPGAAVAGRPPAGRRVPRRARPRRRWGSFLLVTDDDAVEFRLVSCPVPPGRRVRTTRLARGPRRGTRTSASSGSTPSTGTSSRPLRRGGDRIAARPAGRRPGRARHRGHQPVRRWRAPAAPATPGTTRRPSRSPTSPSPSRGCTRWSRSSDGSVTDTHRDEAPGHDPASYVTRGAQLSRARRHARARHDRPAPGHPARRHGAGGALRLRRLRVRSGSGSGRSRCPPCSTVGWCSCSPTSAAAASAGRRWWLDGRLTAKQHTFDDHIAVADGLAAAGSGRPRPHRDPGAERRRAAGGRGLQPASRPLARRASPRCRSST